MKPVVENSDLVMTGTGRPPKAAWRCTENGSGAWRPSLRRHESTLSTPSSTRIRNPTTPCWEGARPVESDVSAAAVVDGTTVVMGPPSIAPSRGRSARWVSSAFQPRPSSTSSTTAPAPVSGAGSHEALSGAGWPPTSVGITLVSAAPP